MIANSMGITYQIIQCNEYASITLNIAYDIESKTLAEWIDLFKVDLQQIVNL